jgi:hypothetical protein
MVPPALGGGVVLVVVPDPAPSEPQATDATTRTKQVALSMERPAMLETRLLQQIRQPRNTEAVLSPASLGQMCGFG